MRFVFVVLFSLCPLIAFAGNVSSSCTYNGVPLYGKVRVVTIGGDFKVRRTTIAEDLRVKRVAMAPYNCGEWQFVNIGEDFTVRFVNLAEDFSIRIVTIAPGAD